MTLEEQFESDGNFCDNQIYTYGCIKIADRHALLFYNWMQDNYFQVGDGFVKDLNMDEAKRVIITTEKAMEIYKKENEL